MINKDEYSWLHEVQAHGVQAAALLRHQKEEKTDKIKQAQIEQTYEKHKS